MTSPQNEYTCQHCGATNLRPHRTPRSPHPAELMAEPKSYRCAGCQHLTTFHREFGCDVGNCDCPAPYGRILPGDPEPSTRAI